MSGVGVLAVIMGLLIGAGIIAGFYFIFFKLIFPDLKYYIKYKALKRKPKEEDVKFLFGLIEKGKNREDVMKEALLSNKYKPKKAKELRYLFLEVEKNMKGGVE